MTLLCVVLIMAVMVQNGLTKDVQDLCGKEMMTAFLHQNKVTGYCLGTMQNLVEDTKPVAFYAYMSDALFTSNPGTRLIFDKVRTNIHGAYNKKTGLYTVPKSGMYVFNWVIREYKSEHSVELVLNNEVIGVTFKRAEGDDDGSVSGTVVVEVNKEDSVFLRTHSTKPEKHKIHNNVHGRSSFSGWRL